MKNVFLFYSSSLHPIFHFQKQFLSPPLFKKEKKESAFLCVRLGFIFKPYRPINNPHPPIILPSLKYGCTGRPKPISNLLCVEMSVAYIPLNQPDPSVDS